MAEALTLRLCARLLPASMMLVLIVSLAGHGLPNHGLMTYVTQHQS